MNVIWLRLITLFFKYFSSIRCQIDPQRLMEVIKDHISPGSVIYSDSWKGYKHDELLEAGFSHFTVNHRYHFVDPETEANTQKIERLWGSAVEE